MGNTTVMIDIRGFISVLRAYGVAYLSTTGPRILTVLASLSRGRISMQRALSTIHFVLMSALDRGRFPAFCGALVAGYKLLQIPLWTLISLVAFGRASSNNSCKRFVIRSIAAFLSAWISLLLLNSPRTKSDGRDERVKAQSLDKHTAVRQHSSPSLDEGGASPKLSGRTIDLTLFAAARAVETVAVSQWRRRAFRNKSAAAMSALISKHADALIFAISSGTIMWSWFYFPEKLPRAYNKWIGEAAQVDYRLIKILRMARQGDFVYGEDKGEQALILQSMCRDNGWPPQWGDGQQTIPIPCGMVHMDPGLNCHWHAAFRFLRAFRFAMATNLPLQLLVKVLARRQFSIKAFGRAFREALQSSAFLGGFVALMYYGICLSRTLIGPRIIDSSIVTPQMWDSGICVRTACFLCGWSILLEARRKRQELAMFVAPRAFATLFPRTYNAKFFWREQVAFSLSIAVLFPQAQEDPRMVRGVLGKLLSNILR